MVFTSTRGSLSITARTSTFSISARRVAQDHPAYIPRRSRAAANHRPGRAGMPRAGSAAVATVLAAAGVGGL